jgi:hypothetical protein
MPKGIVDIQKLIVVPEQHSSELLNALVSAISPLLKMTCFMTVGKRHPHGCKTPYIFFPLNCFQVTKINKINVFYFVSAITQIGTLQSLE